MNPLHGGERAWVREAVRRIEADFQRSSDTHLIPLALPGFAGVHLYLKDESSHPTGSLKHRLARSLFLHALCNGWLRRDTTVVEASSGSTAVSEAYFARLLGLPFVAVMPRGTSAQKIAAIEFQGGQCHLVDEPGRPVRRERAPRARAGRALHGPVHLRRAGHRLARQQQHRREHLHADAARAAPVPGLDRGQRRHRRHAGDDRPLSCATAGTTRGCAASTPSASVFFDHYVDGDPALTLEQGSRIEGIGRPRVEASFVPGVLDAMVKVPDLWSLAAMHALSARLGRPVGGSAPAPTWWRPWPARGRWWRQGRPGSIVTLLCDGGERYRHTYYDENWLQAQGLACTPERDAVTALMATGEWPEALVRVWRLAGDLAGA